MLLANKFEELSIEDFVSSLSTGSSIGCNIYHDLLNKLAITTDVSSCQYFDKPFNWLYLCKLGRIRLLDGHLFPENISDHPNLFHYPYQPMLFIPSLFRVSSFVLQR